MAWPEFHERCRQDGGVVVLSAAAVAADLRPATVRKRARQENWWRPFPDIAATPGTVIDDRARAHAAVLHAQGNTGASERDLAAATRWTAAYLHGVHHQAPTRPMLAIHGSRRLEPASAQGRATDRNGEALRFRVVRSNTLAPADLMVVRHVPTVTPARLVRDLAAVCTRDRLRAMVIDLMKQGSLDLVQLRDALDAWSRFPGRPRVRQVIADLEAAGRTDSPLEFVARRRFEDDGIPLDRGQVPVPLTNGGTIHCDLGILAIRFAIEVDSMGFHSQRSDLLADAQRNNAIMAAQGRWRVMRVTWDLLQPDRWGALLAEVRQVIAAQSRLHLGVGWPRAEDLRR